MSGDRSAKHVELWFERFVSAGHHSDSFQFAKFRVGFAGGDRRLSGTDIRLAFGAEHRKRGAFGSRVEDGKRHRAGKTSLVARVVTFDFRFRPLSVSGHDLTKGVVGGGEIAGHLDV